MAWGFGGMMVMGGAMSQSPIQYGGGMGVFGLYGQQASLGGQVLGPYGGYGMNQGCWGQGQGMGMGMGMGSSWGGGQMAGYFLGGAVQQSQVPIYEDRVYQQASTRTWTEQEAVQTQTPGKMWDVWFDHQDGQKTTQRSPVVLDLNGNGKPDITGKNILGDGKVSGEPVMFDLDPSKTSWEFKSIQRRPGSGAPEIPNGKAVYADGTEVTYDKKGNLDRDETRVTKAEHGAAKYYDDKGNLVGELSKDDKTGKMMYHWGKQEGREKTEWLAKNGGDGLLVWDTDNNGQITSSKELFGEFDANGEKKFKDGYEKLAFYFDKNKDGKVEGTELAGLQVWKDANGDGKTDAGELQQLSQHNITSLDVANIDRSNMESTFNKTTTSFQDVTRTETTWQDVHQRELVGYRPTYNVNMFGGMFGAQWGYGGAGYGGGGYWS